MLAMTTGQLPITINNSYTFTTNGNSFQLKRVVVSCESVRMVSLSKYDANI